MDCQRARGGKRVSRRSEKREGCRDGVVQVQQPGRGRSSGRRCGCGCRCAMSHPTCSAFLSQQRTVCLQRQRPRGERREGSKPAAPYRTAFMAHAVHPCIPADASAHPGQGMPRIQESRRWLRQSSDSGEGHVSRPACGCASIRPSHMGQGIIEAQSKLLTQTRCDDESKDSIPGRLPTSEVKSWTIPS
ncbi:hypothetical protein CALCODRAFT_254192 [Calocera cornea HHB12733]|uniref:Uncharacterized protein n=1 Tax=Calocera cornea HHB12733 TaxID=1353952 RepID=A0A165GM53_9BASI|nr:hypothetical protein CALCODRAFT_254192 [Calocera cornea HHB12733]